MIKTWNEAKHISSDQLNKFNFLVNQYALWSEYELNGDEHPNSNHPPTDRNNNARLWKQETDRLADKLNAMIQEWGFNHLDFGVGLYPTIQKTESQTDGTLHFPYGDGIETITVFGRKWFDKINGNTYNTAEIFINGERIFKTERQYGYGDHYLWIAFEWMYENGWMEPLRYSPRTIKYPDGQEQTNIEGSLLAPRQQCQYNRIHLEYSAVNVKKKEL